jgi:hypothetical protein
MKVTMQQDKDTKGAIKYTELDSNGAKVPTVADGLVGQLYIRKRSDVGQKNPEFITVEVLAYDPKASADANKTPRAAAPKS